MFEFPIDNLLDEQKCYDLLVEQMHDGELKCAHCGSLDYRAHVKQRPPIIQYKCRACAKYFNLFTGTIWQRKQYTCSQVIVILRGFTKGESTLSMSRELKVDYECLLNLRHAMQDLAFDRREEGRLPDLATESDEMYQNAGEKGILHSDPEDPPRRRANKKKD